MTVEEPQKSRRWIFAIAVIALVTWGFDALLVSRSGRALHNILNNTVDEEYLRAHNEALMTEENGLSELLMRNFVPGKEPTSGVIGVMEARFLAELTHWIREENLEVHSITSLPVDSREGQRAMEFTLDLGGSAEQWSAFLRRVETAPALCELRSFSVTPEPDFKSARIAAVLQLVELPYVAGGVGL